MRRYFTMVIGASDVSQMIYNFSRKELQNKNSG